MATDARDMRRRCLPAWLLWSACAMGAVSSLGLAAVTDVSQRQTGVVQAVGNAGLALAFATVGALIACRHARNLIGWLLIALGLLSTLQAVAQEYITYVIVARPTAMWAAEAVAWLNVFTGEVTGIGLVALVLLYFPNGRLPSARWRMVSWLAATGIAMSTLGAFRPGPFRSATYLAEITNPLGVPGGDDVFGTAEAVGMLLMVVALVLAVGSTLIRFRRTHGIARRQLEWLAMGGAAVVAFMVGTQLILSLPPTIEEPLYYLAFATLPVVLGIAMLRHDLYDVDLVLSRTLVWGTLTVFVVAAYVVVVGVLGALIHARGNLVPSLIATGLVAVLFTPLRDRVQRVVNRSVYGDRDDPYAVVSRLGRRLEATLAPESVLPTIVETVAEALKLPYVAIELRHGQSARFVAAHGQPHGTLLNLPLMYQTEPVGHLVLAPRLPEDTFTSADLRILEDLARQVGVAAHAVRLTSELQRSRERLVTAREEERRRLRRDLHDGLGPSLASITLKLDAARNMLSNDPEAVDDLLVDLKAQSRAAIADVRRTVYDLRPPALDELGLVAALQAHAARLEGARLRVVVETPGALPTLPAAVEVAAYRIVLEGLTNVVRHAAAGLCVVKLSMANGLTIEIADDGQGMDDETRLGVGLTAMRERAEELGGTLRIDRSPQGGVRLIATLPLPPRSEGGQLETES